MLAATVDPEASVFYEIYINIGSAQGVRLNSSVQYETGDAYPIFLPDCTVTVRPIRGVGSINIALARMGDVVGHATVDAVPDFGEPPLG